jgi:hypothetical protein
MKTNICRQCNNSFEHEYGQVLCPKCLIELGAGLWDCDEIRIMTGRPTQQEERLQNETKSKV